MVYALASDGRYDDEFLTNYALINLQDRLAKINGVGKVDIMGAGEYAMRIWLKPDRLHYYGLSLDEVLSAVREQSALYPVGKFGAEPAAEDVVYTYTAILPPQISTAEEFSQIIIGGAPLNAEVEAFLRRIKFPLTIGYGMTETAPLISFTHWEEFRAQSCGQVLDGLMEARIADANAEGVGEIQVRGEHVMTGYYKNEEATAQSFTEDGWLRTGDLGTIDEDGFIYIKGRCKTMLLGPSGQNIYPEEIEAKINNMPYVLESLVLQKEDTRLVALVCPDFEAVDADKLTQEQLEAIMDENRKLVNAELAAYEQISIVKLYTHEFEKTPKKSIKRFLYEA